MLGQAIERHARRAARIGVVTTALATLAGCQHTPGTTAPQVLSFNYWVVTAFRSGGGDALGFVRKLHDGSATIEAERADTVWCNYSADFTEGTGLSIPDLDVTGTADVPVFNLRVSAAHVRTVPNIAQPAACKPVKDFALFIGDSTHPLPVGGKTMAGHATVVLGDDDPLTDDELRTEDSQFFTATLLNFDPVTKRTSADFEFANIIPGTQNVLIGRGSFAMDK